MINSNGFKFASFALIIIFAETTMIRSEMKATISMKSNEKIRKTISLNNTRTRRDVLKISKGNLSGSNLGDDSADKKEDEHDNNLVREGSPFNDIGNNFRDSFRQFGHLFLNSEIFTKLSARIIETRYGSLRGMLVEFKQHSPLEVFLGVPYATPPVGSSRFSPTKTPIPWDGVRLCDHFQPVCPQRVPDISDGEAILEEMPRKKLKNLKKIVQFLKNQSEDCLYLNIFAPLIGYKELIPVVVYIHGESFEWGSGNPHDGSVFALQTHSIFITLNYRLGLFGFLNANPRPHLKARVANYGLMDQIAALHWVQQNIALFGGDPSNVTLMGHGTGAACINFLMISPTVVPGLFHRAVLLSGSALSSWATVDNPVHYALTIARSLNCSIPDDIDKDHETIVDCLRSATIEQLLAIHINCPKFLTSFGPSVDGVVIKKDYAKAFLAKLEDESSPFINFRDERQKGVFAMKSFGNAYDVMFGVVSNEAMMEFSDGDIKDGFDTSKRDRIFRTYVRNVYTHHLSEIFHTISNEYTDWDRSAESPVEVRDSTVAAITDAQYVAPALLMAHFLAHTKNSTSEDEEPVRNTKHYFYVFNYQVNGELSRVDGVMHGDELSYFFGAPLFGGFFNFPRNNTNAEIAFTHKLFGYITNFIKFGDPNGISPLESLLSAKSIVNLPSAGVYWEEYDPSHQKYMEIGENFKMKRHYRAHQMSVWLRLIPEIHRSGIDMTERKHSLLKNYNEMNEYEGAVRPDPLNRTQPPDSQHLDEIYTDLATKILVTSTCLTDTDSNKTIDRIINVEIANFSAYSTALSVTIAIGCSLLILNVLIFTCVYYKRDKSRGKAPCRLKTKHFDTISDTQSFLQINPERTSCVLAGGSRDDKRVPKIKFEGPLTCEVPIEIVNEAVNDSKYNSGILVRENRSICNVLVPTMYCDRVASGSHTFPRNLGRYSYKKSRQTSES